MKQELKDFHQKIAESAEIPDWAKIDCPDCKIKIKMSGIREIKACFNARNFGDIAIQYHCDNCQMMNTVYFEKALDGTMSDFCNYLKNNKKPSSSPVVEEEMYKKRYNNLIERFLED